MVKQTLTHPSSLSKSSLSRTNFRDEPTLSTFSKWGRISVRICSPVIRGEVFGLHLSRLFPLAERHLAGLGLGNAEGLAEPIQRDDAARASLGEGGNPMRFVGEVGLCALLESQRRSFLGVAVVEAQNGG